MKAKCSECEAELSVPNDVMVGEIISCPDCGLDYEVSAVNPGGVELKAAEVVGEDWGE